MRPTQTGKENDENDRAEEESFIIRNNLLKIVRTPGQFVWLDYIRRDLIAGGRLRRLIEEYGVGG